ncbi:MAG: hypothetical protein AAGA66_21795, partial [Bacteroidota bacterium]
MKKYFLFLLLIPCLSKAQELDTLSIDSLVESQLDEDSIVAPKHELGAYLLVGINLVPNPEGLGAMNLLGFGIKYDRIEGGFFMSDFDETIERRLIFPNVFALDYRHGGGFIS